MSRTSFRLVTARVAAVAAALLVARPLAAQVDPDLPTDGPSQSAAGAYLALTLSPVGALAPSADYMLARPGAAPRPVRLHARFGSLERGGGVDQHAWAATLDMPVGGASLSLTGAVIDVTCDDLEETVHAEGDPSFGCKGGFSFGARVGAPFYSRSLDAAGSSALVVGGEVTAGYGDATLYSANIESFQVDVDMRSVSATVALPIALRTQVNRVMVAPMLTPRVAYGSATVDAKGVNVVADAESRGGGRFMLGAGVAVRFSDRVGFEAGLQKVFIDEGETAYGLGVSMRF